MKQTRSAKAVDSSLLILTAFEEEARKKDRKGSHRAAANYQSTIHKLELFIESTTLHSKHSTFAGTLQAVTPQWVECFVDWLMELHPHHPETADFYFRNTRAMYHLALAELKSTQGFALHPFAGFKIKQCAPAKRAMGVDEVKKLLDPQLRQRLNPLLRQTLDVLHFLLFAQGMVFQDVYNLRWDMLGTDKRFRYRRSKTGVLIEVSMIREMVEIVDRYQRHNSPYVFPFLHEGIKNSAKAISEDSALRRVNQHAHTIGQLAGLSSTLTTYVMRHTWATLMQETGKPIELISQCLGHSDIRTTQIYLSRISVDRVDAQVDDMFNQLLRVSTVQEPPKRKRVQRPPKAQLNLSIEQTTTAMPIKETEETINEPVLNQDTMVKRKETKKTPFLRKKEKAESINSFSTIKSVAKIRITTILSKFTRDFFSQ